MFTDQEFAKLIGEVEVEFAAYLGKAEESLTKAEDDKKDDKKDEKPEAKEDKKDEPAAKDDAPPVAAKDDKSDAPSDDAPAAPAQDAPAAPADEAAAQAPMQDMGHGYDAEDMAHMDAMYASMSKEELIAHHDSVKKALDAMTAQEAPAAPMAPAAPAPQADMDKCGDMTPMQKSAQADVAVTLTPEVVQSSQEAEMLKSELAAKDAQNAELKKSLDTVTAILTKLVEKKAAPAAKAITQLDTIAKSESEPEVKTFSKQEITKILTEKASDSKLEKSDREAINNYYATGQININGISHLLK